MKNTILTFALLIAISVNIFAQENKTIYSVGMGFYSYSLAKADYVVNPNNSSFKQISRELRFTGSFLGHHELGLYLDLSAGIGTVDRQFEQSFGPDFTTGYQGYLGLVYNPGFMKRFIFHGAFGLNYIKIAGQADYQTHSTGGGVYFTGGNQWTKFLNNYNTSQSTVILGYPSFNRKAPALNIGANIVLSKRAPKGWGLQFNYIPVFVAPVRNDFSASINYAF